MLHRFQTYPASVSAVFTCPKCGKGKRKRTFRAECTVNPFNTNEDGSPKTPQQVREQSVQSANRDRDHFMREPLCAKCEDSLTFSSRSELYRRRRNHQQTANGEKP